MRIQTGTRLPGSWSCAVHNPTIPAEAVEAAAKAFIEHGTLLPALEAAAPHMQPIGDGAKLAAIIAALDPFERAIEWMPTDDEVGSYAISAVRKVRAILDIPNAE